MKFVDFVVLIVCLAIGILLLVKGFPNTLGSIGG